MMENAGASRGAIVIEDRGHLTVEVVMDAGQTTNQVTQSTALASAKALPLRVVYFVQRTRRSVILENAYRNSEYGSEPYIASHHAISCLFANCEQRKTSRHHLSGESAHGLHLHFRTILKSWAFSLARPPSRLKTPLFTAI